MPLNLDTIAPKRRLEYIIVGRQYGSQLTLDQADDFLEALAEYAAHLVSRGFAPRDVDRLMELRDALLESGILRGSAQAAVTAATAAYSKALGRGKQARRDADVILRAAQTDLADAGNEELVSRIEIALRSTASAGANGEQLRAQLATLREVLVLEPVAAATADRGGAAAVTEIDAAVAELRAAEQARPGKPGTPEETERLDLIDGMIVDLVRRARRAARAAAKALGKPAIAEAFELRALYARPRRTTDPGGPGPSA